MAHKPNTIIWFAPNGDRVMILCQDPSTLTVTDNSAWSSQSVVYWSPKGGEPSLSKQSKKSKKKRSY